MTVQADGKILVGGNFTTLGGQPRNKIGRLHPDGTLDLTFNPGADNNPVGVLAVQANGKIVVGGLFFTLGGQPRDGIGRLNPDGTLDLTFNPGAEGAVSTLALQADGKILLGGFFTLGGQPGSRIGRLNPDGTLDLTFNPGANGDVDTLALQADGKIVVGGRFSTLGGQPRSNIGRLNPDGTRDLTFNPGADREVRSLAIQVNGKIVVGGDFSMLGGQPRSNIGRLNPDGTRDLTFNPGANDIVLALTVQVDGKILVGGWFATLGGLPRNRIGRLTNPTAALQDLRVNAVGTTVTWSRSGSGPEVVRVTFEQSLDGVSWIALGAGTRIASGWQRGGLLIPGGLPVYVRARGFASSGISNGSMSGYESVRRVFLPADVTTSLNGFPATVNAGSTVSGNVSYRNVGAAAATGMTYGLQLNSRLSGVTLSCTNGVMATYASWTGRVTFTGAPATLASGQGFSCTASYTAPGGGSVVVTSTISTTTYQGANTAADSVMATMVIRPSVRITDVSKLEGNSGTTSFIFTVALSGPSATTVTVRYATANGSATAGSDFTAIPPTLLTFTPGQTSKTVTVPVNGDTLVEGNETFFINLSSPVNATLADGQGQGTIQNEDSATLSLNDVSKTEGNSGTTNFVFTVTLSAPSQNEVTVRYVTANGSATSGSDYTTTSGTLTFPAGRRSGQITVPVRGETGIEANETFVVRLSAASGATIFDGQGVGTILNDDGSVLRLGEWSGGEGNSGSQTASFTVTLTPVSTTSVTVRYATTNGSATAGSDYTTTSGTLTFTPGQTSKVIAVPVRGETGIEANETFLVNLNAASGATIFDGQGVGTILNDDGPILKITNNPSVVEGNSGSKTVSFIVTRTPVSTQEVRVSYVTANNTAVAPGDYMPASGTVTFPAHSPASQRVIVSVQGDTDVEANEMFVVVLSNASGATIFDGLGIGTITNDD